MNRTAAALFLWTSTVSTPVSSLNLPVRSKIFSRRISAILSSSKEDSGDESDKKALISCPQVTLSNGVNHPKIGFGTYKVGFIPSSASSAVSSSDEKVERSAYECVLDALQTGYRFLECAEFYNNEAQVGKAIKDSNIPRKELFLCSKVWTTTIDHGPDAVKERFYKTLQDLQTDYLDLYLIHWPVPNKHIKAYIALQELYQEGKVRGIGFSNYAVEDYLELKQSPGFSVPPVVNQIEINPFLYRKNTINFFEKEGVTLQSYRSLRDGKAFQHPTLVRIAQNYNKTTAQILGRWCVQHGFIYLPKSVKKHRMQENAKVFDFTLTEEDLNELDSLTSTENLETFQNLYRKCVNRDTSLDGTLDGVKMDITVD